MTGKKWIEKVKVKQEIRLEKAVNGKYSLRFKLAAKKIHLSWSFPLKSGGLSKAKHIPTFICKRRKSVKKKTISPENYISEKKLCLAIRTWN